MKNFGNAQHDTILESTIAIVDLTENWVVGQFEEVARVSRP
jgi:hypothetical protein